MADRKRCATDVCFRCGAAFYPWNRRQMFCSPACHQEYIRRITLTRSELEAMVWSMPTIAVAAELGVPGAAVAKRCKALGIVKPGPGYWNKVHAGKIKKGERP